MVDVKSLTLKDIRLNLKPPPLKGGREFSKGPEEAFRKIEDILSLYALEKISYDEAVRALNYAKVIIRFRVRYPEDVKEHLIKLYDEAIKLLKRLKTPKRVKEWLLSNGPPRKGGADLTQFLGG